MSLILPADGAAERLGRGRDANGYILKPAMRREVA
jgi:hypothetical protein